MIWLENLNLRGEYKTAIMDCIQRKHPDLLPLYQEIYNNNDRRSQLFRYDSVQQV